MCDEASGGDGAYTVLRPTMIIELLHLVISVNRCKGQAALRHDWWAATSFRGLRIAMLYVAT